MNVLAFDLGGTRMKAGLIQTGTRRVIARATEDAPDGAAAIERLTEVGRAIAGDEVIDAVGVAVPGLVDVGSVVALPDKLAGIVGLDLSKGMRDAFGTDAVVVNDAIAYGMGEAHDGAAAGFERVVVVTIGTGVGVAVFQHGAPVTPGMLGGGILGGQAPLGDATIEQRCNAAALHAGFTDVPALYAAHAAGDPAAVAAMERYRGDLARALAVLALAHAPSCIVVGGGPVTEDAPILAGLEALIQPHLYQGYRVQVRRAALGDDAALFGLARLCEAA